MHTTLQTSLPPKKRRRSIDSDSTHQVLSAAEGLTTVDVQGAEVLTCLRAGNWHSTPTDNQPTLDWSFDASTGKDEGQLHGATGCKKRTNSSSATRAYVWRCPSRRASQPLPAEYSSVDTDPTSCDDEGYATASHKARDKDWSALTTWLRMNLHNPRTLKKQVLFVGYHNPETRQWAFDLNPALDWNDVSADTKLRLKTLTTEAEEAFVRKYPGKPRTDWGKKCQKYRPLNSSHTVAVPMGEMVYSLQQIYETHEGNSQDSDETETESVTQYALGSSNHGMEQSCLYRSQALSD